MSLVTICTQQFTIYKATESQDSIGAVVRGFNLAGTFMGFIYFSPPKMQDRFGQTMAVQRAAILTNADPGVVPGDMIVLAGSQYNVIKTLAMPSPGKTWGSAYEITVEQVGQPVGVIS